MPKWFHMHIIWLCERKSGIDMDNFIDFFHIALILITSRDSGLQTDIGHGVQGAARQPLRIRKRVRMAKARVRGGLVRA